MWKEIVEGNTRLMVPEELLSGAIVRRPIFYNPRSKLSRDVSCAVARALMRSRGLRFLDLLAGTGARGIRVAKEAGCDVHLNDVSARAVEVIRRNSVLNGVTVGISNSEGNVFITENPGVFDMIDVDPYGSPAPYLSNALEAVKKDGFVAFAATDAAALHGLYPKACERRYSASALHCEFGREVGLRVLLGYAARVAAAQSKGMRCILSHSNMHFFRAYLEIVSEKGNAESPLENMGYLYYCKKCLNRHNERATAPRAHSCECGGDYKTAGPLWLGSIADKEFSGDVLKASRYLADAEVEKLLSTLTAEPEVPFYYDVHALSKNMKISSPKMEKTLETLKDSGFDAARTHFSPTGIKTDASVKDVKRALLPVLFFLAAFAELLHGVTAVMAK